MIKILSFLLFFFITPPLYAKDNVIEQIYQTLNKDYINQISPRQITLKGLQALQQLDPQIKATFSGNKIFLYRDSHILKTFDLPQTEDDPLQWAALSEKIIDQAINASEKIELLDFEIPDRFAQAVFEGLDGYSHYYGAFANDESSSKVLRRNYGIRLIGDVMLIKILNFHSGVSQKVAKAVEECSTCRGIILDLRGNHGGILDEALKITDLFLDEGMIAYTAEKDGQNPKFYTATTGDIIHNRPLVVLIDGFSASASEILAAALSEQNRAILIGTKSFGKGTIQDVIKFDDNRAMALTSAFFFTPSGAKIDQNGLNPAICTGGISKINQLPDANCEPADRFYEEVDVQIAVKYIKNEL